MEGNIPSSASQKKDTSALTGALSVPGRDDKPEPGSTLSSQKIALWQVVKESEDGRRFIVFGEMIFELDSDGRMLRQGNGSQWAKLVLQDRVRMPEELRAHWLDLSQRRNLIATLDEQAISLEKLTSILHLEEADPFDVLLKALFDLPPLGRDERVARLCVEYESFFARFAADPLASRTLDAILAWYVFVPMAELRDASELNISRTDLLSLPTIIRPGMLLEVSKAFCKCGVHIETALEELQRLLYSV